MTAGRRRRADPAKKHGGRRLGAGRRAGGATKTSQPIGLRISLDAIARAEAAGQTIGQRVDLALREMAIAEDLAVDMDTNLRTAAGAVFLQAAKSRSQVRR